MKRVSCGANDLLCHAKGGIVETSGTLHSKGQLQKVVCALMVGTGRWTLCNMDADDFRAWCERDEIAQASEQLVRNCAWPLAPCWQTSDRRS